MWPFLLSERWNIDIVLGKVTNWKCPLHAVSRNHTHMLLYKGDFSRGVLKASQQLYTKTTIEKKSSSYEISVIGYHFGWAC